MFRIHQRHQANIPTIKLYINFKEVALNLYNQADKEPESSIFPKRDVAWEEHNNESDEDYF